MKKAADASTGYLDILRLMGIIAVIMLHTVSGISDTMAGELGRSTGLVYSAIKALGTIGVPLFLMVSGALMLDPGKEISIRLLFTKYIKRLVLALLVFGVVFALGEMLILHEESSPAALLPGAVKRVLAGKSWAHLWYMYVIIGLYLALPLLRAFIAGASERVMDYSVLLLLVFTSLLPAFLSVTGIAVKISFPFKGVYVTYFILGYYLRQNSPFNASMKPELVKLTVLLPLLYIVLIFGNLKPDISYASPITVIWAVSVFELVRLRFCERKSAFCEYMREYIFGMYLIHTVFLNFCYKLLGITPLLGGGYVLLPVFVVVDFAVSFVGAWVMKRLPGLKNIV